MNLKKSETSIGIVFESLNRRHQWTSVKDSDEGFRQLTCAEHHLQEASYSTQLRYPHKALILLRRDCRRHWPGRHDTFRYLFLHHRIVISVHPKYGWQRDDYKPTLPSMPLMILDDLLYPTSTSLASPWYFLRHSFQTRYEHTDDVNQYMEAQ